MQEISVSVRQIVEFILRAGSIDTGYMSQSRMMDGIRVHQRVQRARKREYSAKGLEYEAEMRLRSGFEYGGMKWSVSGVADGVVLDLDIGVIWVEEIKSTHRNLEHLTHDESPHGRAARCSASPLRGDSHWHMAQAKCYGHMLAEKHGVDLVTVNLSYCAVESDSSRVFTVEFTAGELKAFFYDLIERYRRWAELKSTKTATARSSAKEMGFPYADYRKGQREFAAHTYYALRDNTKLYIEAPTGTGKTISALFPAVKALGEGHSDKIFYLTAKTITRQAAEHAAQLMQSKGAEIIYVVITAKDKICPWEERSCTPAACARADGHFDRVNDALWELLNRTECITRSIIEDISAVHMVCPYELTLDATLFADIIICDYNYVFDPTVSLKRFFGGKSEENYSLLIDEAHNLADRAREMFSASLFKKDFDKLRKNFRGRKNALGRLFTAITNEMSDLLPGDAEVSTDAEMPDNLVKLLRELRELLDPWLAANNGAEIFNDVLEAYFGVQDFLRVYENMDERYTVYIERSKSDVEVTFLCLDPRVDLAEALEKCRGAVFFSATLTPLDYFKNMFAGNETDKTARFPSPFDHSRLCTAVENRISTKYKDRNESSFSNTADALYAMFSAKRGNYFAFFSSYAYLDNVLEIFTKHYPDVKTLVQSRDMKEDEREGFLSQFSEDNSILAFAVMGGIFSEGVDLVGDKLIGAAIVGVGLPQIGNKRDALRDYYDRTINGGFEYAYMYPGMNKVMQAAGRVIRAETDRGVILLLDTRFSDRRYLELFPLEWRGHKKPGREGGLSEIFREFWAMD